MTGDPKDQKLVEEAVASLQANKNNFADIQDTAPVKRLTLPNAPLYKLWHMYEDR